MAGPSDGSGVWMKDRPKLAWAAVWFGIALLARLGLQVDDPHMSHVESWAASAAFPLPCCWFLAGVVLR